MQKKLLTAAVAAAVALPMIAQAGVYGRADGVVRSEDTKISGSVNGVSAGSSSRDAWDVGGDKMRWGIVGSEDLGNGMKALYHYEYDVVGSIEGNGSTSGNAQNSERTRLAYAGLEGGWGKMTIGRNWVQSYGAVWSKTDMGDAHATGASQNNLSGNRSGNMVQYTSPDFSGFTFGIDLNIDDDDASHRNEDGVDWYEVVGQYKNGPLQVGVAYRDAQLGVDGCSNAGTLCNEYDQWGIGASYSFGDLTVEGNYGNRDNDGAFELEFGTTGVTLTGLNNSDSDVWGLAANYKFGDTHIYGGYRNSDTDLKGAPGVSGNAEVDDYFVGVRHFLSKETRIFAEYQNTELDVSGTDGIDRAKGKVEYEMFAVGLRKDWKL